MDPQTLNVYNRNAASIAARHLGNHPNRIHELVLTYFQSGRSTADIGCGSGRDTRWLNDQGYPAVGFDGSEGMLAEARRHLPTGDFRIALLPELQGIPDQTYHNVLCNAVLMHLPKSETPRAVLNLARVLQPGGRLIVSFRGSRETEEREGDGRLFTRIALSEMTLWMAEGGLIVLEAETLPDPVRAGNLWHTAVAARPS